MSPVGSWEDWLEMPPEQGRRRFGPLPDRVRIGSDPGRCDIVLARRLGVPDTAVELRRNDRGTWTVEYPQPTTWPCTIHTPDHPGPGRAARAGSRIAPGEALVLEGRETSPRFLLRRCISLIEPLPDSGEALEVDPIQPVAAAAAAARTAPTRAGASISAGLAAEASRQAQANLLASNGTAQQVDQLARLARQRVWTNPTMLVSGGIGCAGVLFAAVASAAWWFTSRWGSW